MKSNPVSSPTPGPPIPAAGKVDLARPAAAGQTDATAFTVNEVKNEEWEGRFMFDTLPAELIENISAQLPASDLSALAQTSDLMRHRVGAQAIRALLAEQQTFQNLAIRTIERATDAACILSDNLARLKIHRDYALSRENPERWRDVQQIHLSYTDSKNKTRQGYEGEVSGAKDLLSKIDTAMAEIHHDLVALHAAVQLPDDLLDSVAVTVAEPPVVTGRGS